MRLMPFDGKTLALSFVNISQRVRKIKDIDKIDPSIQKIIDVFLIMDKTEQRKFLIFVSIKISGKEILTQIERGKRII